MGHDPARWPRARRSLVLAAVLVVLAGAAWLAVAGNKPHAAGRPFGTPAIAAASSPGATVSLSSSAPGPVNASTFVATFSPSPATAPPALVGPAPTNTGVRLLVAFSAPTGGVGVFILDGGAISAVRGFPAGGCPEGTVFRIPATDQWAVIWQPTIASQPCGSAAGSLYIIDAATSTAHLIGAAEGVVAADRSSLWTVAGIDLRPAQQLAVPEQVQRISLTGVTLSRVYALPVGWTVIKGLNPDLLLLARDLPAESDNVEAWQPSTGTVLGHYDQVLAANADVVVWVNTTCAPDNCPVHLSAPAGGADRTVTLPAGAYAYDGSLSDDGNYLALSLGTGVDTQGATDQDTGVLVDLSSRAVHLIPQTKIPASQTGSLSLNWSSRGWLIVSTPGPNQTSQLAAYNPTTGTFVVSQHRSTADQWVAH